MPNTEHDSMDRGFEWRLKATLDRVTPPPSSPRYQLAVMGDARVWPIGPVLVAAGATVLLAISATAFTGSPNPAVWAERAGSTLQSVGHTLEVAPSPEPKPEATQSAPAGPAQPTHDSQQEGQQTPEPSESPEPRQRPDPPESSDHSGDPAGPRLSPTPPAS